MVNIDDIRYERIRKMPKLKSEDSRSHRGKQRDVSIKANRRRKYDIQGR